MTIFDFLDEDHPPSWICDACVWATHRRAFGRLYHCAKFGWNPYSCFDASFHNLRVRLENAYSRPQNWGLPRRRRAGLPTNTMSPGPRPTFVPSGILVHQPFGHNRHGLKSGWLLCPLFWGVGAVCPSNTMWPRPKPTSIPSGIVIHPTVWPQYTNVADRETGQTGQTDNGQIG